MYDSDSSDGDSVYCQKCRRSVDYYYFQQHLDTAHKHYCDRCRRDFVDALSLRQHSEFSNLHHYCIWCSKDYENLAIYHEHIDTHHARCSPCKTDFFDQEELERHYEKSSRHDYCYPCNRHFDSADHLKHHLASSTHQERDTTCFHPKCSRQFISLAATIAHYDAGGCPHLERFALNARIRLVDRDHLVIAPGTWGWDGPNLFHCNFCSKRFDLMSGAVSHVAGGRCGYSDDKVHYMGMVEDLLRAAIYLRL